MDRMKQIVGSVLLAAGALWAQNGDPAEGILEAGAGLLPSMPAPVKCADRDELAQLEAESGEGAFAPMPDAPGNFVYYSASQASLTWCREGQTFAASLPGEADEERLVSLTHGQGESSPSMPFLRDWDGDGALEFAVFDGACVEGPCLGAFRVIRAQGQRLRELYRINAEALSWHAENGKEALIARSYCFDYDFGAAFAWIDVLTWDKGKLRVVPKAKIRTEFPQALATFRQGLAPDDAWQALVLKAYDGVSWEVIAKRHKALLALTDGEFPGHCDPLEVLQDIAGRR